ncbi:transcription initiation factor TFIID subunit 1 isoform X2 [Oryza brachyantha]|uniref:transcription initiation factor TFIID subunit 1 isoform X2 n=1 Tax=Oryza brachyantha TaxID=4533 RepID=UPI0003EAD0F9|nr:transcription initiation factor TFIID subunit 1 isoform X2 [Oryza brachyantha]XP_006644567.1 transcription initiation factor TFIID subunit 1 isoform X2 [Oryza brachyantha]XP_040377699.1 transcription initiation factor TFIID subunit 1 isoform X2 [Oryza brachyantha]
MLSPIFFNLQPPSEKVHQIIARTALFVSEHGGQSEIVLRVKQGSNPTFGFLMPDHHLHSYFRYLVDHPQVLKDGVDADSNKGCKTANSESELAVSSGGALSLLGAVYESGDEDEGMLPPSQKVTAPGKDMVAHEQGHENSASGICRNEEAEDIQKAMAAAAVAVKDKSILTKKNPMITDSSIVAARQEKVKDAMMASSKSDVSDKTDVVLEPPSFLKRTMEKIVEFILRNGKEFEGKLIEQDRTTGRFPFLLPSNPYHSYYLKLLEETQESKSSGNSSELKDRRGSSERKEHRDRRSSSEHKERRSSSERKVSSHGREETKSKMRLSTSKDASSSDRSSAEPSEKQLYDKQKQGKGKFHMIISGAKKEPPRNVTADEAAAIVMAATRGLVPANTRTNTPKDMGGIGQTRGDNGQTSSFGSFSSFQDPDVLYKPVSNSEAGTSLTSSGQLKTEGIGIIDDDWIANTIAKAAAVAASKEADSSEASMTKEQKLKAERLRRAKMFASIIKSGGSKMADLSTSVDATNETEKTSTGDLNLSGSDPQTSAKEREGSSVPFEREGSTMAKQEKYSDDEQSGARKYRKKHTLETDEESYDSEESYKYSRKRHHSEHSRAHTSDAYKHKHKKHSKKDLEPRNHRHHHSSSEDEHEHRSSKSRHRHRNDYHGDDDHRSSHRHQRDHRSSSKRKKDDDRDKNNQTRLELSQNTSGHNFESEKALGDAAQSSQVTTEVPSELRAKIRAMLLETL